MSLAPWDTAAFAWTTALLTPVAPRPRRRRCCPARPTVRLGLQVLEDRNAPTPAAVDAPQPPASPDPAPALIASVVAGATTPELAPDTSPLPESTPLADAGAREESPPSESRDEDEAEEPTVDRAGLPDDLQQPPQRPRAQPPSQAGSGGNRTPALASGSGASRAAPPAAVASQTPSGSSVRPPTGNSEARQVAPYLTAGTAPAATSPVAPVAVPPVAESAGAVAAATPVAAGSAMPAPAPTPHAAALPAASAPPSPPAKSAPPSPATPATPVTAAADPVGADPLYVFDPNAGLTLPAAPAFTGSLHTFSTWSEDLRAQVSNASVTSYTWNFSQAPDATAITGTSTYDAKFTWASFTGAAHSDTITVSEMSSGGQLNQSMTFSAAATAAPGSTSSRPTTAATWPTVVTPDTLSSSQASVAAGSYADIGLAAGDVQTTHMLPSYNPGGEPVSLVYDSAAADPQPVFLVHYQLDPTQSAAPPTVTAQLTLNGVTGTTVYDNTSALNPGDTLQLALQGNASALATGRYNYQINVTANYPTPEQSTYSGSVNIVNDAASPEGAGWSLANVTRLFSTSGGVVLEEPGGTSLWFANGTPGNYVTPAGDFSTLVQNGNGTWTRTLADGTQVNFDTSGRQTSVVDTIGNTTSFGYNGQGQLTTITDMNGLVTTLAYNAQGQLTTITDPANRVTTLSYNTSNQLTSITDADNGVYGYGYDSGNHLTTLTDPRNNATTFGYNFAGQATTVTRADNTTEQLAPAQLAGLAGPGSGTQSNPLTAVLEAATDAAFTDPRFNVWLTQLDPFGFGLPVSDADPLGDVALTYRDGNGLPWQSVDALGRDTRTVFDSKGNPTLIVQPDGSTQKYSYNTFSEVTQATDPTSAVTGHTYNGLGELTQQTDALNHVTTYTYNTKGALASVTDPLNHQTTYGYDSRNRLTSETNALNQTTAFAYDTASDLTSTTDPLGYVTSYRYDALGRTLSQTLPDSLTTFSTFTYTYDAAGNQTSVTNPLNHATTYNFDKLNRITSSTDALNEQTTYGYDAAGNQISVTDPLGHATTYSYDAAGRQASMTDALNHTTTYGYDAAGEQTRVTDPLGHTITSSYTLLGQLTQALGPLGDVNGYGYNAAGDQTTQSQSGGGLPTITSSFVYNALHQQTTAYNQLNNPTSSTYDADGNLTSVTDALNHTTTYGYDALNRQTSVTDPLGDQTTYSYDAGGNQTSVTDPLGRLTTSTFDAQHRLLSETNPLSGTTSYTYDLAGQLTSETDPDHNTTSYGYDAAGRLTSVTNPLGYATTYSYDAAGRMIGETDADGRQQTFGYDADNRETSNTWLNSNQQAIYTATYTYDAGSELTAESDPYSAYALAYNAGGELTSVDNGGTPGVPHVILSYGYNGYGERTSLNDGMSLGGYLNYSYDATGELVSLTAMDMNAPNGTGAVSLSYNAVGQLATVTRQAPQNALTTVQTTYDYDAAGRTTAITDSITPSQTTLESLTYSYDKASEITGYSGPDGSMTYSYDTTSQLTSVSGSQAGTYSYDANGNRTLTGYTTGTGNELTSDGAFNFTYDHMGNLLTATNISNGQVTTFTWDYRNRLTEVVVQDSHGNTLNDERFTYDVENRQIGVWANGTQQRYTVYDGPNPYLDFNGSGTLTERYLADPAAVDALFARMGSNGALLFYLGDLLGSVREIVDGSGNVLDALTYNAFGGVLSESNPANGDRFKFADGEYDAALGLYRFGERYYSPLDGRFISTDPTGLGPDSDPYRYGYNDPTGLTDPTGLEAEVNRYDPWFEYLRRRFGYISGGPIGPRDIGPFAPYRFSPANYVGRNAPEIPGEEGVMLRERRISLFLGTEHGSLLESTGGIRGEFEDPFRRGLRHLLQPRRNHMLGPILHPYSNHLFGPPMDIRLPLVPADVVIPPPFIPFRPPALFNPFSLPSLPPILPNWGDYPWYPDSGKEPIQPPPYLTPPTVKTS